jgi:hypothetical protein
MSIMDYESGSSYSLTRTDGGDNCYDPDIGINRHLREHAVTLSARESDAWKFLTTKAGADMSGKLPPGFLYVQMGPVAHLVYVRVTLENESVSGTGPMPGILIDQARICEARPHVVRVHFRNEGDRISIQYFGHDELEKELKAGEWWRRKLLHGRTAHDCLRLVGGQTFRLEVSIKQTLAGTYPVLSGTMSPEEEVLRAIFNESDSPTMTTSGSIEIALRVDPDARTKLGSFISISALVTSTYLSDECFIFTCSCGVPECTGITAGVNVIHEEGLVVWRMRGSHPRRLLVFDEEQYRLEILTKVRAAMAAHLEMDPKADLGASEVREWIEDKLTMAGIHAA